MEYQVPQYIEIEDKIIGPFTLKQFLYIVAGGVLLILLFRILKLPFFIIFAIPICGLVYLLAFHKIAKRPFIKVVGNFLGFIRKPSLYVWKKGYTKPKKISAQKEKITPEITKKTVAPPAPKKIPKGDLEEMQWKIDIEKK